MRRRDFAALVLLLIGPFVLVIGWLAGVWLLWTSDRWSRGQKLLGTLAWPLGYAAALVSDYVLVNPLWVTLVVANLITIGILVVLAKNARRGQFSAAGASPVASGNS